jgi:hypothetical protein
MRATKPSNSVVRNFFMISSKEGVGVGRTTIKVGISDAKDHVFVVAPEDFVISFLNENRKDVERFGKDWVVLLAIQAWMLDF